MAPVLHVIMTLFCYISVSCNIIKFYIEVCMEKTGETNAMSFSCQKERKEGRRNIGYIIVFKTFIESKFNQ